MTQEIEESVAIEEAKKKKEKEEQRKKEEEKKRKEEAEKERIRKEEAEKKRLAEERRKKEQAISNKVAGAFGIGSQEGNSQEMPDPEPAIRVARSEIPTTGLMKVLADMVRST